MRNDGSNRYFKWALWLLTTFIAPTAILLFVIQSDQKDKLRIEHPSFTSENLPTPQISHFREFHNLRLEPINRFDANVAHINPIALIRATYKILVIDKDFSVVEINDRGEQTGQYDIPKNTTRITSFPLTGITADANGVIWICGPNGHPIGFDQQGKLYILTPNAKAFNLVATKDYLVVMNTPPTKQLFKAYSLTNAHFIKDFGAFWAAQDHTGIELTGSLVSDPTGDNFVYAPRYGGFLASFSGVGERRFLSSTIESRLPPAILGSPAGIAQKHIPDTATYYIKSLSISDNQIFVLSNSVGSEPYTQAIDVYDLEHGEYYGSFVPPQQLDTMLVGSGYLYGVVHGKLRKWGGVKKIFKSVNR